MYNLCKSEFEDPVSSTFVFLRTFNHDFNLAFHAPISDSCRKCDGFNVRVKAAAGETQGKIKREQELRHRKAEAARMEKKHDAEIAKTNHDITVLSFDLMKTLATPVISTSVAYYKTQLWTFCFRIHDLQSNIVHMYM